MKTGPIFLAAGVAVLGGLFVVFKPKAPAPEAAPVAVTAPQAMPAEANAAATPTAAPAASAPKTFEIVVAGGKLVSGGGALPVNEGDEVILKVTSDKADELHLHGYDLELKLLPNTQGVLQFTAKRSGRFEFELHKLHAELGALEVQPKP